MDGVQDGFLWLLLSAWADEFFSGFARACRAWRWAEDAGSALLAESFGLGVTELAVVVLEASDPSLAASSRRSSDAAVARWRSGVIGVGVGRGQRERADGAAEISAGQN